MSNKLWIIGLLSLMALVMTACQEPTLEPANSSPLPLPGISVIQSEPTPLAPTSEGDNVDSLIATIAADPVQVPTYVQGTSGEKLVPLEGARIVYYNIEGATEEELRAQLDELGPVDPSGYKGDAVTDWQISWTWPSYGSDDCDLSEAEVSYTVKVIFPRWIPPEDAPNNLVITWFNYTYRLAKHEKGHVDYVVENYEIVLDAIKGATCETADAAAEAALGQIRAFDLEYDRQTGHGATQGARFP